MNSSISRDQQISSLRHSALPKRRATVTLALAWQTAGPGNTSDNGSDSED